MNKMTYLGISINWLLNSEGAIFSNDSYGEIAKQRFISYLDKMQNMILANNDISNQAIRHSILIEYGTIDGFIKYLQQFNITLHESSLRQFLDMKCGISADIEDLLRKIYFFFFHIYSEDDKEDIKHFIENILIFSSSVIVYKQVNNDALAKIKEIIDNCFEN